jgi:hypothetical protein
MTLQSPDHLAFQMLVGLVQEDQVVAGLLRDSVLLCRALGWVCNGHPASVVVKNQRLPNIKISIFSVPSSFEPGGRELEPLRARKNLTSAYQSFSLNGMRALGRARSCKPIERPTLHSRSAGESLGARNA